MGRLTKPAKATWPLRPVMILTHVALLSNGYVIAERKIRMRLMEPTNAATSIKDASRRLHLA